MNYANLSRSHRLQRVRNVLMDACAENQELSTLEIADRARVCAVSACVSELRAHGYTINCRRVNDYWGKRIWLYSMEHPEPLPNNN